ncbi:DMT family transporter [Streptosporangium sp. NPDC087985]|uniref:DMT family transporter n=1 Tax=Streptosporangium sp. NPDC087985 TaxID=3366196 RepID=UPI0037F28080
MIAAILAVCAAAGNAVASVLQRRAARLVPKERAFRLSLIWALIRQPVWLGGLAALIAGFAFQASALSVGGLALVQPILVTELPITMILIAWAFGVHLDRRSWLAVGAQMGGLVLFLLTAAPEPGDQVPDAMGWTIAIAATVGLIMALVAGARFLTGPGRAAVLGGAAGLGFSFTATFMKESTSILKRSLAELAVSWELYAMVAAGLCSLFLLENAFQSGTLVAAQPAVTISDPVASVVYGVMLFGEEVRTGPWIVGEVAGIGLIVYGSILLSQSAPIREQGKAPP